MGPRQLSSSQLHSVSKLLITRYHGSRKTLERGYAKSVSCLWGAQVFCVSMCNEDIMIRWWIKWPIQCSMLTFQKCWIWVHIVPMMEAKKACRPGQVVDPGRAWVATNDPKALCINWWLWLSTSGVPLLDITKHINESALATRNVGSSLPTKPIHRFPCVMFGTAKRICCSTNHYNAACLRFIKSSAFYCPWWYLTAFQYSKVSFRGWAD
jgi:hypothetical protein